MDETAWHLDRRVPLALIGTIAMQIAVTVWWAAGQDARLASAISNNLVQDQRLRDLEQDAQGQKITSTSLSAQMTAIRDTLDQLRQDQRDTQDLLRRYLEGKSK